MATSMTHYGGLTGCLSWFATVTLDRHVLLVRICGVTDVACCKTWEDRIHGGLNEPKLLMSELDRIECGLSFLTYAF